MVSRATLTPSERAALYRDGLTCLELLRQSHDDATRAQGEAGLLALKLALEDGAELRRVAQEARTGWVHRRSLGGEPQLVLVGPEGSPKALVMQDPRRKCALRWWVGGASDRAFTLRAALEAAEHEIARQETAGG